MKPVELIIRCYAESKRGVWQAFCLNFDLAVQGDSLEEVQEKMKAMVNDYVYDALADDGADRDFASQLLTRRAPVSVHLKYYRVVLSCRLSNIKKDLCRKVFDTVMPLSPTHHA